MTNAFDYLKKMEQESGKNFEPQPYVRTKTEVSRIKSFANGLNRDCDAVENAVAYDFSNGFVEGTNSKLKMIKRTMYGRCNISLLKAKMMLNPDRRSKMLWITHNHTEEIRNIR